MDRTKSIWQNPWTITGAALAFIAVLFFISFQLIGLFQPVANPYVGIWTYLVLPVVLVIGLLLIPIGYMRERRRRRRLYPDVKEWPRFPTFDLNNPAHLRATIIFLLGTAVAVGLIAVSSYEGYHYTDSTEFCGRVCHEVMEPEYTTYQHSPHARVGCAECHIGSGASWFVKAKISGVRQVFAVAFNTYSRPIPTPVQDLRPARETCEECHWPAKFYASQLRERVHFSSDQDNTRGVIRVLLKTGGADTSTGMASGIHWHMALSKRIEYVATDRSRQVIPWVKATDLNSGISTVYRSDGKPADAPPPAGEARAIDCMDCHNRPTHIIQSPDTAVDTALEAGKLDRRLPFVKKIAVDALVQSYADDAEADSGIDKHIRDAARSLDPGVAAQWQDSIDRTVGEVRAVYRRNFFPLMKVDWRAYPNNIGHMIFDGCFRCHDGKHADAGRQMIRSECMLCHEFLEPLQAKQGEIFREAVPAHPVKLEGIHARLKCSSCHTGGRAPAADCEGCHSLQTAFRKGTAPALPDLQGTPGLMADLSCDSCHDLSKPLTPAAIAPHCETCHQQGYGDMIQDWKNEMAAGRAAAAGAVAELEKALKENRVPPDRAATARSFLEQAGTALQQVDKAGAQHNTQYAGEIFRLIVTTAAKYAGSPPAKQSK